MVFLQKNLIAGGFLERDTNMRGDQLIIHHLKKSSMISYTKVQLTLSSMTSMTTKSKKQDLNTDAYLISYDEEEVEVRDSEYKDA